MFANQITGSINEREIIINPSSELNKESSLLTVHGNNKNDTKRVPGSRQGLSRTRQMLDIVSLSNG